MIMQGARIGSRRTACMLALGLALAGCTTGGDSAEPSPTPVSSAPSRGTASNPEAPAIASSQAASATAAIRCLDGEWAFGTVQRHTVVSHVSEPLVQNGAPVSSPPLRAVGDVVAEVEGNAPPELTYAQVRRLLPPEPSLPPLGARPQVGDRGFSYQTSDPGPIVFYELADVISVDYRYTCQGRPEFGSVTSWTQAGGGVVGCVGSHPQDPPEVADVRAIACPPA